MKKLALMAALALTAAVSFNASAAPALSGLTNPPSPIVHCTFFNGILYCVPVNPPPRHPLPV